jgi:geranylgeranyl diphosphate synthase type 3
MDSSRAAQPLIKELLGPYVHVSSYASKQIRAKMVDAFNRRWLRLPPGAVSSVKSIVDMLHNASLLIDDIQDSSAMRRGAPAAHHVYGAPLTLNCANYVYFLALEKVIQLAEAPLSRPLEESPAENEAGIERQATSDVHDPVESAERNFLAVALVRVFTEAMIELHEGQGMDIYWRDSYNCPTLEEYNLMVRKKTGGLFRLALRLMIALANAPGAITREAGSDLEEKLLALVGDIGVFFQTLDDLLNVTNIEYHQNKSFCEDITEGKFSYPIIHCIHRERTIGDSKMFHILCQRTNDIGLKKFCVSLMEKQGSLEACRARIDELKSAIEEKLVALGGCGELQECLDALREMM